MSVTGALLAAFGDALYTVLAADATLKSLARSGSVLVAAALPRDARVPFPYVIVGSHRDLKGSGFAMQIDGGEGSVVIDVWSDFNGPEECQDIQARIRLLLSRDEETGTVAQRLALAGVSMFGGSLTCEDEQAFPDVDADMPERMLYHGVQRWTASLEEVAS